MLEDTRTIELILAKHQADGHYMLRLGHVARVVHQDCVALDPEEAAAFLHEPVILAHRLSLFQQNLVRPFQVKDVACVHKLVQTLANHFALLEAEQPAYSVDLRV